MSDTGELTGMDLWTPNDYSNFITICAAAIGSTLLVIFKSRCVKVNLCCGMWSCDREIADPEGDSVEPATPPRTRSMSPTVGATLDINRRGEENLLPPQNP